MKASLLAFICIVLLSLPLAAQDTIATQQQPDIYLVELKDGSTIMGTLVSEDVQQLVLQTKSMGTVTIPRSSIKSARLIDSGSFVKGEYWFDNPNETRYLIGPSAFCLEKGEGYYQNLYLVVQSFNVGVTDQVTLGGGFEIISILTGSGLPAFFITPKIGFEVTPRLHLGAGALYANMTVIDDDLHFGVAYGLATYGTTNNNVTLGAGWAYKSYRSYYQYSYSPNGTSTVRHFREGGFSELPIITLSGMARPKKRFAVTTENWIMPVRQPNYSTATVTQSYQAFFSYGMRFMGEKISVDFGLLNHKDIASDVFVLGLPYVDFVVKFGRHK